MASPSPPSSVMDRDSDSDSDTGSDVSMAATDARRDNVDFAAQIIANDLLCRLLFSYCTPASIARLAKTCREGYAAAAHYAHTAWDINRALSRYFADPLAFRSLQARTGMLVSGSFALQFFGRLHYPESDLDMYVSMPVREEVAHWVVAQGYRFVPYEHQEPELENALVGWIHPPYPLRTIAAVFTFVRDSPDDPTREDKVQMIVAHRAEMEVILDFHSTCVMNVISFDTAFSLYPIATFEEQRTLAMTSKYRQAKRKAALQKYRERGWTVVQKLRWPEFHFSTPDRWLYDRHTWVMPLDTAGVDVPVPPPSPLAPTSTPYRDPLSITNWKLERTEKYLAKMRFNVASCSGQLVPFVNADEFVLDIVARVLNLSDKSALHNRLLWDPDEDATFLATNLTPQTQEIVRAVFAFQAAAKRVNMLKHTVREWRLL